MCVVTLWSADGWRHHLWRPLGQNSQDSRTPLQTRAGKIAVFFVKLYCVVLDCILGIATYWICALSKGGAYCMVYYLVLANILNKRYGLHRAGEIIFFVSLKLNSANGLSKYESVNHVTIKSIWPWKEKTLTCDCQSCDRKNIWWPQKDFSQLSVPWQQSSKNRKQLKI